MSRATVLARGRTAATAGMTDTCTITRVTATSTDKDSGIVVPTATSTLYSGACRVQQRSPGGARAVDAGEAYQLMLAMELHIPTTVTGIEVGDLVTITAAAYTAGLVGRTYRVRELADKSQATAQRLGIEEATS